MPLSCAIILHNRPPMLCPMRTMRSQVGSDRSRSSRSLRARNSRRSRNAVWEIEPPPEYPKVRNWNRPLTRGSASRALTMGPHIRGLPHSPCTSTTGIRRAARGRSEERPSGSKRSAPAVGALPRPATEPADGPIAAESDAGPATSSRSRPTGMEPEPMDRVKARIAMFWSPRRKPASRRMSAHRRSKRQGTWSRFLREYICIKAASVPTRRRRGFSPSIGRKGPVRAILTPSRG